MTCPSKALINSILSAFTRSQNRYMKNIAMKILKAVVPLIILKI
jgi:hypothetical protein